jgi:molybdate transport system substrate-binding protein
MTNPASALNCFVTALLKSARTFKYVCGFVLLVPRISLHKRVCVLVTCFFFILTLTTTANAVEDKGQPQNVESVTVLVSSSMTAVISEISRNYSREKSIDLNAVFEAPYELVNKIQYGDPADIIIVSDKKWLDTLQEQGMIDPNSRVKIAGNRLSLVASKNFKLDTKSQQLEQVLDLIHNRALMVIGDPNAGTLGKRSEEVLRNVKKLDKFKSFVVLAPTSAKTVDLIIKSQTAGIIYATDARLYNDNLQYIGDIPQKLHKPIQYYAAVVLGNNMREAKKFLDYLKSSSAQKVLEKAGFVLIKTFPMSLL